MKKLTRKSLDELAKVMPVISETAQRGFIGGSGDTGVYTYEMYVNMLENGTWTGGQVEGMGYVLGEVTVTGSYPTGYYGASLLDRWMANAMLGSDYYDDSGYMSTGIQTGGSGGTGGGKNMDLYDGIGISNSKNFTFNTAGNAVFDKQLKRILQSNSVVGGLLGYFNKGYVHMTFDMANLGGSKGAHMNVASWESYHMTFNSQMLNQNGWNQRASGDNVGYNWSNVRNMNEALVVIVTHEAIHANHFARYYDAMQQAGNRREIAANSLLNNGYSQEYVNIFFMQDGSGKWIDRNDTDKAQRLEDYIRNNNHGVIDAALQEYRSDYGY